MIEVGRAEDLYPGHAHMDGLVVFGSNGGLEGFCFDHDGSVLVIAQGSFSEFLVRLVNQTLFEPRT